MCEFCEGSDHIYVKRSNSMSGEPESIFVVLNEKLMFIKIDMIDKWTVPTASWVLPISYCPICGKKLSDIKNSLLERGYDELNEICRPVMEWLNKYHPDGKCEFIIKNGRANLVRDEKLVVDKKTEEIFNS